MIAFCDELLATAQVNSMAVMGEPVQKEEATSGTEPVSRAEALQRAKFWIVRRYGERAFSPVRDLATELLMRAVIESLRASEAAPELEERLTWCIRFVENLQLTGRNEVIDNAFWTDEAERTDQDRKLVELHQHLVWRRYDPRRAARDGWEGEHFYSPAKQDVAYLVADYLSKPWARHSAVDWVLLDMLVTGEVCAFGSNVEGIRLPGGKITLLAFSLAVGWVLPLGFIWWAFGAGYETIAWVSVALFAVSTAWWLLVLLLRFGLRVHYFATGKPDRTRLPRALLQSMFETWDAMASPVVNPTHVRDVMARARDLGAVWDPPAWAIVDSVIQRDSAVWVTTVQRN